MLTFLLARWPRRSVDRRQCFHGLRDRCAIRRRQLRCVPDYARHRAAGGVAIGHLAGFEEIGDVLLAPLAKSFLRNVRHPALALGVRSTGEALSADDAAKEISRAVTFRAMAEAVDQI